MMSQVSLWLTCCLLLTVMEGGFTGVPPNWMLGICLESLSSLFALDVVVLGNHCGMSPMALRATAASSLGRPPARLKLLPSVNSFSKAGDIVYVRCAAYP